VRLALSLVAGTMVAYVAAVLLGEYAFEGVAVIGAGVVLGLIVSEAVTSVAGRRSPLLALAGAVLTVAGLLGAAWITTDERLSIVNWQGWLAVALGAVAAAIGARPLRARSHDSHADPEPEG